MGRRVFTTGTGEKDVVIMGAETGGSLTQSGWETMGVKNVVARDGYVSVRIDSTTDSRPVPVPFTSGIPVPFLPVKSPAFFLSLSTQSVF